MIQNDNEEQASFGNLLKHLKEELMKVFVINKTIYEGLENDKEEKDTLKDKLTELSILLERMVFAENEYIKSNKIIEVEQIEAVEKDRKFRVASKKIVENKGYCDQRKKTFKNPRVKNRRKAEELVQKSQYKHDKNIDITKTRTQRFE